VNAEKKGEENERRRAVGFNEIMSSDGFRVDVMLAKAANKRGANNGPRLVSPRVGRPMHEARHQIGRKRSQEEDRCRLRRRDLEGRKVSSRCQRGKQHRKYPDRRGFHDPKPARVLGNQRCLCLGQMRFACHADFVEASLEPRHGSRARFPIRSSSSRVTYSHRALRPSTPAHSVGRMGRPN